MTEEERSARYGPEIVKIGALVAASIVIPGLASRLLHAVGLSFFGSLVWAMSFFGLVFVVWYLYIRPIDFQGT